MENNYTHIYTHPVEIYLGVSTYLYVQPPVIVFGGKIKMQYT